MIRCVLIGLRTLISSWKYQFQWYVMECKFFGVCVVSKGAEKTCFTLKMIQMMRTFHIPINLDLNGRGSREGHNHNTYQIGTKFLVNVILCAWSPDFITLFTRNQYRNAVIGARYPNAVIWLVRDTYPNAAIWSVRDTYPNATIWLVRATNHSPG